MLVYPVALAVALIMVPLTRGSYRRLAQLQLHHVWALLVALAIQVALEFDVVPQRLDGSLGFGLLMASYALILAFCFVNFNKRGFGVLAVGVLMNTVAVGVNRGMPYTVAKGETPVTTIKHHPETSRDLLPFLGDIIVLPEPWRSTLSFGDLVIAVGLVDVCYAASRRPRRVSGDDEGGMGRRAAEPEPVLPPPPEPVVIPAETIDLVERPVPAAGDDERVPVASDGTPVRTLWRAGAGGTTVASDGPAGGR